MGLENPLHIPRSRYFLLRIRQQKPYNQVVALLVDLAKQITPITVHTFPRWMQFSLLFLQRVSSATFDKEFAETVLIRQFLFTRPKDSLFYRRYCVYIN